MNSTTERLRVLCIIPYAGSVKLTEMTSRMLRSLFDCIEYAQFHMGLQTDQIEVFLYGNAPKVPLTGEQLGDARQFIDPENIGFGRAINNAIALHQTSGFTHYLILNNDLEFPYDDWLECLLSAVDGVDDFMVLSPATGITSNQECVTAGPLTLSPRRLRQVSAYAWLVPARVVKAIKPRFGFELFDPDFFCYGEDDYTGAILRKIYGGTPFKVVYSSWVRHLKGKTGEEMGLKSGMKVNVDLLKRKLKANKLK
jgi:GT2 family glycosyltransferase